MSRFAYYASGPDGFGAARGDAMTALTGLPSWARMIVALLAIPGVLLIMLSLVLVAASIAALLILTVPAYRVLRFLVGSSGQSGTPTQPIARPTRRVEATVID
jgi:hypothetical protein